MIPRFTVLSPSVPVEVYILCGSSLQFLELAPDFSLTIMYESIHLERVQTGYSPRNPRGRRWYSHTILHIDVPPVRPA